MALSTKQKRVVQFAKSSGQTCLSVGTIRSGKTYASVLAFILYTQSLPRPYKHLLLGKKFRVLETEIMPTIKSLLDGLGIPWKYARSAQELYAGGQIYCMGGGNDETSQDRIRGLTIHSALIDESTQLPESYFDMAMSRLSFDDGKVWITCNPASPLHFLKTKWLDRGLIDAHYQFEFGDNPTLTAETIERYRKRFGGVFAKRMIDGLWAAADGLVYPDYTTETLDWSWTEHTEYTATRCTFGIDYGTASVTAFVPLLRLRRSNSKDIKWYVPETKHIEAGYGDAGWKNTKTDNELAEQLIEFAEPYRPNSVAVDPSATSFRNTLKRWPGRNFNLRRAYNDVLPGIRIVNVALGHDKVTISPDARKLIDELDSYAWDDDADEKPIKQNDHHVDALRYGICSTELKRQTLVSQPAIRISH